MRVVSLTGATSVTDPAHGHAEAGPDGVFELPEPFAHHLLKTAAGMFRGEAEHLAALARGIEEDLRNPHVAVKVLAALIGRVSALEAQVAGLQAAAAPEAEVASATVQDAPPVQDAVPVQNPPVQDGQDATATAADVASVKGAAEQPVTDPADSTGPALGAVEPDAPAPSPAGDDQPPLTRQQKAAATKAANKASAAAADAAPAA